MAYCKSETTGLIVVCCKSKTTAFVLAITITLKNLNQAVLTPMMIMMLMTLTTFLHLPELQLPTILMTMILLSVTMK